MPTMARASVDLETNVSTETIRRNIHAASLRNLEWLSVRPASSQTCLIVGGGPSLVADIETIRAKQRAGDYLLALNGSARFLNLHGIMPDALMLLDARPDTNNAFLQCETLSLFLASQCDPSLFDEEAIPPVTLFHIDTPHIGAYVPGERQITAIGGGCTVGLIALSLAYTQGFRDVQLYGYDSSYQDVTHHAYPQPQNDEDDTINVMVAGREFITSPWMVYQVEQFQQLIPQLAKLDCLVTVHGSGLLPFVAWHMLLPQSPITETEKYAAMWAIPDYRQWSPGEQVAAQCVEIAQITAQQTVIDFGCGTGRGGWRVQQLTGCSVIQVDLIDTARDPGIDLPFICADLTDTLQGVKGDVGMCCDVMEHFPTADVEQAIINMMDTVQSCFFQISLISDSFGQLIGQALHLTIKPADWWVEKFSAYQIIWSLHTETTACFFITNKEHSSCQFPHE